MIAEGQARLERNYKEDEPYLQGLPSPFGRRRSVTQMPFVKPAVYFCKRLNAHSPQRCGLLENYVRIDSQASHDGKLLSGLLSFYLAPASISSGMVSSSPAIKAKALWPLYRVSGTPISSVTRGSRSWCNALSSGLSNWSSGGDLSRKPAIGRSSRRLSATSSAISCDDAHLFAEDRLRCELSGRPSSLYRGLLGVPSSEPKRRSFGRIVRQSFGATANGRRRPLAGLGLP
jgi:hypothetical protein